MVNTSTISFLQKSRAWLILARPPFHSVGILPLSAGFAMAWKYTGMFSWEIWGLATVAVVLIMLSTYWAGECFDYKEDKISGELGRSKFAGGTGMVQSGIVSRRASLTAACIALVLAGLVGLFLWLACNTGPWTIPLGLIGMIGGFLYSTPPVRWVSTGTGELWIGFCYALLPVTVGYYLTTGVFNPLLLFVGLPIAATIFNVILANEYPDYISDQTTGKRNMLYRLGRESGARLYVAVSVTGWVAAVMSVWAGVPLMFLVYYLVPFAITLHVSMQFLRGEWRDKQQLERICALGILANLATNLAYILAFVWG